MITASYKKKGKDFTKLTSDLACIKEANTTHDGKISL